MNVSSNLDFLRLTKKPSWHPGKYKYFFFISNLGETSNTHFSSSFSAPLKLSSKFTSDDARVL